MAKEWKNEFSSLSDFIKPSMWQIGSAEIPQLCTGDYALQNIICIVN